MRPACVAKWALLVGMGYKKNVLHLIFHTVHKNSLKFAKAWVQVVPFCAQQSCIRNVVNEAGMCGKSMKYIAKQPFIVVYGYIVNQHGGTMSRSKYNCLVFVFKSYQNSGMKHTDENFLFLHCCWGVGGVASWLNMLQFLFCLWIVCWWAMLGTVPRLAG